MQEERLLAKDRETISAMFDSIAGFYDRLNHILSFGIDGRWRNRLVRAVIECGAQKVSDVACGSGDVSIALHNKGLDVTGVDISEKMLEIARKRNPEINFLCADSSKLPFADEIFDSVTVSFGIRNFDKRNLCIRELFRVLKRGGTLHILEFSIPRNRILKGIYSLYLKKMLPVIARSISGLDYPYKYLSDSIFAFPSMKEFCNELKAGGFTGCEYKPMTGGTVCLYKCIK